MGHHIAHTFFDVQEAVQESTTHYPLVDDLLDWILIQKSVATQAMANRPQSLLQCCCWSFPTNMVNGFSCFEIWLATLWTMIGYLISPSITGMLNVSNLCISPAWSSNCRTTSQVQRWCANPLRDWLTKPKLNNEPQSAETPSTIQLTYRSWTPLEARFMWTTKWIIRF